MTQKQRNNLEYIIARDIMICNLLGVAEYRQTEEAILAHIKLDVFSDLLGEVLGLNRREDFMELSQRPRTVYKPITEEEIDSLMDVLEGLGKQSADWNEMSRIANLNLIVEATLQRNSMTRIECMEARVRLSKPSDPLIDLKSYDVENTPLLDLKLSIIRDLLTIPLKCSEQLDNQPRV